MRQLSVLHALWFCSFLLPSQLLGQAPTDTAALEALGLEAEAEASEGNEARGRAVKGRIAAVVQAELILQDGETTSGVSGTVTSLNVPFTNGSGAPGFTGSTTDGALIGFVWSGSGVVWANTDAVSNTLTGVEVYMGIGDGGQFIYSPATDGDDSVWTQNGLLAVENTQAPGFPSGVNSTFHSRPTMTPSGVAYWISGFNETGSTATEGRVFYRNAESRRGATTVVLRSDDLIGGLAIDRPSGIGFDYDISHNGLHHIHELLMDTGSTANDGAVYFDGALVARETQSSGAGDNWDNFDHLAVNDSGDYLFSGDTDGATTSDEFIAYNGAIVLREGALVGGVTLTSSATVQGLALNNFGQAVHLWNVGGAEVLFLASDASNLVATSVAFLATGDGVDLDGDGVADAIVEDFNTFGKTFDLATDQQVMVEVDLAMSRGVQLESILALDVAGTIPVQLQSFSVE